MSIYLTHQKNIVDDEMSLTSTNPVQNKVVMDYIDKNDMNLENTMLALAEQAKGETKEATIVAGNTTVTFTNWNNPIGGSTYITVYTDEYAVQPTNVTYTTSSITVEIAAQDHDVKVSVMVFQRISI